MDKPRIVVGLSKPRIVKSEDSNGGVQESVQEPREKVEVQNSVVEPKKPVQEPVGLQQRIESQAVSDITPVKGGSVNKPFEIDTDLKGRIEEDQKKRKGGLTGRIREFLRL